MFLSRHSATTPTLGWSRPLAAAAVDQGISGNRVLHDFIGPNALAVDLSLFRRGGGGD